MGNKSEQEIICGCKANIYLRITGRRKDGFHDLESLFLPLQKPADRLLIRPREKAGIEFDCSRPELAKENIVVRAFEAFARKTGLNPGYAVYLEKNIPHGSGLGGGSSDAAGMLSYLNARAGEKSLSPKELLGLGMHLGADVPFFLKNKPAWVSGVGETVRSVQIQKQDMSGILICPGFCVSTARAYKGWDENGSRVPRGMQLLTNMEGVYKKSLFIRDIVLFNSFEQVVFRKYPQLARIKYSAFRHGARGCVMSGSGSSMLAFFRDGRSGDDFGRYLSGLGIQHYKLDLYTGA